MEESSNAVAPPFNPLPLPASRSVFPAPLKFLWFNRKNQSQGAETRDPNSLLEPSEPDTTEKNEICAFLDNPTSETEEQIEGTSDDSDQNGGKFHSISVTTDESAKGDSEQTIRTDGSATTGVPITTTEKLDFTTARSNPKSWISRIIDLKALWPDFKTTQKQNLSGHPSAELQSNESPSGSATGLDGGFASSASEKEKNCSCSEYEGCSLEVPYMRVLHSRESFSKFLQNVSPVDMKVIAQMSVLCDMAYMIPDIQPGQLLKYHHLQFVTSSLDRKAEAAAKEKETNSIGKLNSENHAIRVDDFGQVASEELGFDPNFRRDFEQNQTGLAASEHVEGKKYDQAESLMAVAPVTAVVVAEEETKQAVTKDRRSSHSCPCEWFVCDDNSSQTRIFVIQGSESLASWQANLSFEPMKFEGLDILVHRGIYEAAKGLYEQVLPEVLAHFNSHGDLAQIRLTGHSLGGSLAALLALLFQIRGVLPHSAILPVITFGSPCIMCGGDTLLRKLNLPQSCIQSVIMHRDIVPRAFACDYPDRAAQVLKRLNGRFQDHPCLNNQKLLYAPMGYLVILQPDEIVAPSHPLLPVGNGLYLLRHPINGEDTENATQLRAAQRAFLNMPHPLEILSDPGAYGFEGAISRDHDPRSYTKVLHSVLRHELKRMRRLQREQRRQLWWPLVMAESSSLAQKGPKVGMDMDQPRISGAASPAVGKRSLVFKQPVNYAIADKIEFPYGKISFWGFHKETFSRYARLVASQHVQMGMLVILSVRMVIMEGLSILFVWI